MEIADSVAPDAIILDMRMPITNGLQFLRADPVEAASRRGTCRYRDRRLFSGRCHTARAAIAWRLDPLQADVSRRSPDPRPHHGFLVSDRFLRACRLEPVDATPVWFMRQAGRYLPQYRALREKYSLLDLCRHPELAVIVTLQPLDVIDLDAAILFSDLLLPFTPMGLEFDFVKGEGPSIANPIRSAADVARLTTFEPEALGHVLETIRLLRRELEGRVPLIGFGGAPFTLAAYAIEGGPSKDYLRTKMFMYEQPASLASPLRALCRRDDDIPAGAGGRRRAGAADFRFVGRRARPRRLSRVRAAAHHSGSSTASPTPACRSSISASAPRPFFRTWSRPAAT